MSTDTQIKTIVVSLRKKSGEDRGALCSELEHRSSGVSTRIRCSVFAALPSCA